MEKQCPVLSERINKLEQRILKLENECCGYEASKIRIETANSLKALTAQFNTFVNNEKSDWKDVNNKIDRLSKMIYLAIGAITVVQLIGLDKILKIFGE